MTAAALERRYRRLLALYPRAFRDEHEEEMLAVLLAGAGEARRRPGLADSANLIGSATFLRLRPGAPRSERTVFVAVRLMYAGAALELIALLTVLVTLGSVRATVVHRYPSLTDAQWHTIVAARIVPDEVGAPIVACLWLWLAWANGRGHGWARIGFAALFGLTTVGLFAGFAEGAATYAPADMVVTGALWLVAFAAFVLVFTERSGPYYRREPAPS